MMDMLPVPVWFDDACEQIGLALEPGERDRLAHFLTELLEANQRFNLTAIRDPEMAWRRHILESIALLPLIGDTTTVADVGTGGGLPGMPLAIVMPQVKFTLIESTGKKVRYLQETAKAIGLENITVIQDRAETAGQDAAHRGRYEVVTARAVGPLNVLCEFTIPLAKTGGRVLAVKGARFPEELDDATDALMILGAATVEVFEHLPGMEDDSVVIELTKQEATPREYPRLPGVPKKEPL